jgi:tetraacyldisaccharide 4'-kinase
VSRVHERLVDGWEQGFAPVPSRLLGVAGAGYRGLLRTREWMYARGVLRGRALQCPVVSIGNLTVGGTGKTPAVVLAARTLLARGYRPAIASRGYGRRSRGVQVVSDPAGIRLEPEEAGDEPFLLARRLPGVPVVVGGSRYDAGRTAVERFGSTALVLDDAFQHRTLRKDVEIVMARARRPWGNGCVLPAGPLREPLAALARADLVVATGARGREDLAEVAAATGRYAPGMPLVAAAYAPAECRDAASMQPVALGALQDSRPLAFAGIAAPAAFQTTLEEAGVVPAGLVTFPDHHWYTTDDLLRLDRRARELGAGALVTTEKDWSRLRRLAPPRPLYVLGVELVLGAGAHEWDAAFDRACRTP